MKEISDRYMSALLWLTKANTDLAEAIHSVSNKQYAVAYSKALRVQESIRQLLEVDKDLTSDDRDVD